jgi:hypothetical protein
LDVTVPAVAVNGAVLAPAATLIEAATLKAVLLLESETVAPPEGATWLRVTVHVEGLAEANVVGLQAREETTTAVTSEIETF